MTTARKIALDLGCFIDFKAAHDKIASIYWEKMPQQIPFEQWGSVFFANLTPRVGVLGFLWEHRTEGGLVEVFTHLSEGHPLKERAEGWLRTWLGNPHLQLHATSTPMLLEQQAYFVTEGHSFTLLSGFERVLVVPPNGPFPLKAAQEVIDLDRPMKKAAAEPKDVPAE